MVDLNTQNLERIVRAIRKLGVDPQVIDIKALWDKTLTYAENKANILEKARVLSTQTEKKLEEKYQKDEEEALEMEMSRREEEHFKEEWNRRIEEIKNGNIGELEEYFKEYYIHIDKFLENRRVNSMVVVGSAGIGKSFNLIVKLKEKGIRFEHIRGHITPLAFYRKLYEHREGEVLVIDDIAKLIKEEDIVSLLLGACDYDARRVEWNSASPLTTDLPKEFIFNSKIIILANEFDARNEFLNALKDRSIYYELNFTKEQIIEMLYILARRRGYPVEIVDYLKGLSEANIIQNLSLRLLEKVYPYHSNKEAMKSLLEFDENSSIVLQLMKSNKSVKEQVEEFFEKTGLSRRTYFRIKAEIRKMVERCV